MEKFDKKIEKLNNNETFQSLMTYEEDQRKILNTEKHMIKNEIALNLLKNGMSKEIVSENTGLPIKEIEDIMKENNISSNEVSSTEQIEKNKAIQIAKSLMNSGLSMKDVQIHTGLTIEELEDIRNQ